eukprot:COSAG06_NODE_1484_length_9302_cov_11.173639_6_plen_63_part_00
MYGQSRSSRRISVRFKQTRKRKTLLVFAPFSFLYLEKGMKSCHSIHWPGQARDRREEEEEGS